MATSGNGLGIESEDNNSPISNVSADVLAILFFEVVSSSEPLSFPAVALSHVCRRWREIAFEVPTLWSTIFLQHLSATQHYLRCSKNVPLDVHWSNDPVFWGSRRRRTDKTNWNISLSLHSPRFRAITFAGLEREQALPAIRIILNNCPILESFRLSQVGLEEGTNFKLIARGDGGIPSLQKLHLGYIKGVDMSNLLQLIKGSPQLNSLSLLNVSFELSPDPHNLAVVDARHVRDWDINFSAGVSVLLSYLDMSPIRFAIRGDESHIALPSNTITQLELAARCHNHLYLGTSACFRTFDGSCTTSLEVQNPEEPDDFLFSFLPTYHRIVNWSALTNLHFVTDDFDDRRETNFPTAWDRLAPLWPMILERAPNVRDINIRKHGFCGTALFSALGMWGKNNQVLCPRLETLWLTGFRFPDNVEGRNPLSATFQETAWIGDALQKRMSAGKPVQTLVFEQSRIGRKTEQKFRGFVGGLKMIECIRPNYYRKD